MKILLKEYILLNLNKEEWDLLPENERITFIKKNENKLVLVPIPCFYCKSNICKDCSFTKRLEKELITLREICKLIRL